MAKKAIVKKSMGVRQAGPKAGAPVKRAAKQKLPEGKKLSKKEYERLLIDLQIELLKMQSWITKKGKKLVVIFEGRDAAGKGGTILRLTQHLQPRTVRKVALSKPTEAERGQWYFQRYVQHLPTTGEIVVFDRSWYNRAGVERVMGFCTPKECHEFLRSVPQFEQMIVNSGTILVKYWLDVSHDEQRKRFKDRAKGPLTKWKLSPLDKFAQKKWDDYTKAKHEMFRHTHQDDAPWTVVKFDDKRRGRINCIRHLLTVVDYSGKDGRVASEPDFSVVGDAMNPEFGR